VNFKNHFITFVKKSLVMLSARDDNKEKCRMKLENVLLPFVKKSLVMLSVRDDNEEKYRMKLENVLLPSGEGVAKRRMRE